MTLKPQDLLVLLKIIAKAGACWTYGSLAAELGMSPAEVHSAVKRAYRAGLAVPGEPGRPARPVLQALEEFVRHGVQYVFIAEQQSITRGVATAWAAPMLADWVISDDMPPVWPHPEGTRRGQALSPLYRSAPQAALADDRLYELLALIDMLRMGRAREKALASKRFSQRLAEFRDKSGRKNEVEHEHWSAGAGGQVFG